MKKVLLREALRVARTKLKDHPQYHCFPHWSFVVQYNKILDWATNHALVPPVHLGYQDQLGSDAEATPKTHAEYAAWVKTRGLLDDAPFEVINIRLNRAGELRMSAPCNCCRSFLTCLGCKTIWFTTESGWSKTV